MRRRLLLPGLLLPGHLAAQAVQAAPLVVTLRQPESGTDPRQAYDHAVIRLALDKTLASHGPYRLELAPAMNIQRALVSAAQRRHPNFLVVTGPDPARTAAGLVPVRFPLHLGAVGYRVCFVSPQARDAVAQARTLDALRRFRIVQGDGWADGAILRANGFRVEEVPSYEAMFRMVAQGRVDLFCRSVLEVRNEALAHADLPALTLDRSFALVYDLPQFFYTHQSNRQLVERLTAGLAAAHADGSLLALFRAHMRASLRYADLPSRRLFRLATPPVEGLDFDHRRYDLDLARELH
ncbi:MAG: hypothetical protein QM788_16095 [Roseateles sp.]|uniref:hypothetical protein n=1 Tax=Roseateles sp. TaxID=1971397 RepID=UPI0039ECE724